MEMSARDTSLSLNIKEKVALKNLFKMHDIPFARSYTQGDRKSERHFPIDFDKRKKRESEREYSIVRNEFYNWRKSLPGERERLRWSNRRRAVSRACISRSLSLYTLCCCITRRAHVDARAENLVYKSRCCCCCYILSRLKKDVPISYIHIYVYIYT